MSAAHRLAVASRWIETRAADLTPDELEFVRRSIVYGATQPSVDELRRFKVGAEKRGRRTRWAIAAMTLVVVGATIYWQATTTVDPPSAATDPGKSGLVAPMEDDSAADIMSWVDAAPVTDWGAEIQKRDRGDRGLSQRRRCGPGGEVPASAAVRARGWRGTGSTTIRSDFNGIPFVLLKTLFDLDPNDPNPTLRTIARVWKRQATALTASGPDAWTMDHIGVSPGRASTDNGIARPAGPAAVPYGFAFENPQTFVPARPGAARQRGCTAPRARGGADRVAVRGQTEGGPGGQLGTRSS